MFLFPSSRSHCFYFRPLTAVTSLSPKKIRTKNTPQIAARNHTPLSAQPPTSRFPPRRAGQRHKHIVHRDRRLAIRIRNRIAISVSHAPTLTPHIPPSRRPRSRCPAPLPWPPDRLLYPLPLRSRIGASSEPYRVLAFLRHARHPAPAPRTTTQAPSPPAPRASRSHRRLEPTIQISRVPASRPCGLICDLVPAPRRPPTTRGRDAHARMHPQWRQLHGIARPRPTASRGATGAAPCKSSPPRPAAPSPAQANGFAPAVCPA